MEFNIPVQLHEEFQNSNWFSSAGLILELLMQFVYIHNIIIQQSSSHMSLVMHSPLIPTTSFLYTEVVRPLYIYIWLQAQSR